MNYAVNDFQTEVIQRSYSIPVLCDFWAEWCGPCRMLSPVLEKLAENNNGRWVLAKLNTEEHQDIAAQYAIRSIPNVKLFYEGKEIAEFVGALPEYAIAQWLKEHLPGKHDKVISRAGELLEQGNEPEAISLLEEILSEEPDSIEAKILLAKACLFSNTEKASGLLEGIEEPKYFEVTDSLHTLVRILSIEQQAISLPESSVKEQYIEATRLVRLKNFDKALETFIEIIRTDRYYDEDGSRKACIAIFKYLGEEHPVTLQHRKEFSRALY